MKFIMSVGIGVQNLYEIIFLFTLDIISMTKV